MSILLLKLLAMILREVMGILMGEMVMAMGMETETAMETMRRKTKRMVNPMCHSFWDLPFL